MRLASQPERYSKIDKKKKRRSIAEPVVSSDGGQYADYLLNSPMLQRQAELADAMHDSASEFSYSEHVPERVDGSELASVEDDYTGQPIAQFKGDSWARTFHATRVPHPSQELDREFNRMDDVDPIHQDDGELYSGPKQIASRLKSDATNIDEPVIQMNHKLVRVPVDDPDNPGQTSDWAVSDSLDVTFTSGGSRHTIPPSEIHDEMIYGGDQVLRGALTFIFLNEKNEVDSTSVKFDKDYKPHDIHTEGQLVGDVFNALSDMTMRVGVLGAILEIRQLNSPCASCQKMMTTIFEKLYHALNKPVIVRASAQQLYEHQPGAIGGELHSQGVNPNLPNAGPPDMNDVTGIHQTL